MTAFGRVALAVCLLLPAGAAAADEGPDKQACASAFESAQRLRRQGALLAARAKLQMCARAPCPEALYPECTQWLSEVEHALPSIVVAVRRDDGTDVKEARVFVDDLPVAERLDGRPIELDPGEHVVRVDAHGQQAKESILVAEGEKSRTITFKLPKPKAVAPPPPPPAPPIATRPVQWPTYVFGGMGIIAAGIFAGFALSGDSVYRDLERCRPGCDPSLVDEARGRYVAADVALGVSLVAVGVAVGAFLLRPRVYVSSTQVGRGQ
jgi:hypothetical protein